MTNRQGEGVHIGAAILVGGKSRRLGGRPKGLFKVDGIFCKSKFFLGIK